jgi:hypothetical protein
MGTKYPAPSTFKLMIFRMSRTRIKLLPDENNRDYAYCKKNGWFESEYYYRIQAGPVKKLAGKFFDFVFYSIYKKMKQSDNGERLMQAL